MAVPADLSDFLVQAGAVLVAGFIGYLAASRTYQRQKRDDDKRRSEESQARRTALLTYLASEVRVNRAWLRSMSDVAKLVQSEGKAAAWGTADPFVPSPISVAAYHEVMQSPDLQLQLNRFFLSLLVEAYSYAATYKEAATSLFLESHSGNEARKANAMKRLVIMGPQLRKGAERFDVLKAQLEQMGFAAVELGVSDLSLNGTP